MPIKLFIPLIFLCFIILQSIYIYFYHTNAVINDLKNTSLQTINSQAANIQGILEFLQSTNNIIKMQELIAQLSFNQNLVIATLSDTSNKVLASTKISLIGNEADLLKSEFVHILDHDKSKKILKSATSSLRGTTWLSQNEEIIYSIYPITINSDANSLRPNNIGILFQKYTLVNMIKKTKNTIFLQELNQIFTFSVITLFIAFLIHRRVSIRISDLSTIAKSFTNGNYDIKSDPKGNDEISFLAKMFNDMVRQINYDRKKLQNSERKFHTLTDSSPAGIFETDGAGNYIYTNKRWQKICGLTKDNALKQSWYKTIHAEDKKHIQDLWEKSIRDHSNFSVQYRITTSYNKTSWVFAQAVPNLDFHGNFHGYIGSITDITDNVTQHEQLKDYRNHLEDMIKTRTDELEETHKKLLKAEKMSTLGQLTATLAHELRNPLGVIENSLFILDSSINDSEKQKKPINLARKHIKHCVDIINDLLDFGRDQNLHATPVEFDQFIAQILNDISIPKDIQILTHLNSNIKCKIDQSRFRRIINNLLSNAVHAIQEKNGHDYVGKITLKTSKTNSSVILSIEDNGVGIKKEILERIFEPLFSTKSFGVGLGMAVIKKETELHKGTITIESDIGKGTVIKLTLPTELRGST